MFFDKVYEKNNNNFDFNDYGLLNINSNKKTKIYSQKKFVLGGFMKVKIDKEDVIVSFEKDFSDVLEYLGAKKGTIRTTVPYLYNGEWTNLLYEIAYYELDLDYTYTKEELDMLTKTGKVVLLSSKPYICVKEIEGIKEEAIYAEENLTTLKEYNSYLLERNSKLNNELVLNMLKKYNEILSQHCIKREKSLRKKNIRKKY